MLSASSCRHSSKIHPKGLTRCVVDERQVPPPSPVTGSSGWHLKKKRHFRGATGAPSLERAVNFGQSNYLCVRRLDLQPKEEIFNSPPAIQVRGRRRVVVVAAAIARRSATPRSETTLASNSGSLTIAPFRARVCGEKSSILSRNRRLMASASHLSVICEAQGGGTRRVRFSRGLAPATADRESMKLSSREESAAERQQQLRRFKRPPLLDRFSSLRDTKAVSRVAQAVSFQGATAFERGDEMCAYMIDIESLQGL